MPFEAFVRARQRLKLSRDRFGNLLLSLPARGKSRVSRWVFTAHMDHPGFVARRMIDARTLEDNFYGGVKAEFCAKQRVRFFSGVRENWYVST